MSRYEGAYHEFVQTGRVTVVLKFNRARNEIFITNNLNFYLCHKNIIIIDQWKCQTDSSLTRKF